MNGCTLWLGISSYGYVLKYLTKWTEHTYKYSNHTTRIAKFVKCEHLHSIRLDEVLSLMVMHPSVVQLPCPPEEQEQI